MNPNGTCIAWTVATIVTLAAAARAQSPATQPAPPAPPGSNAPSAAVGAANDAALLQAATDGNLERVKDLLAHGVGRPPIPPAWLELAHQSEGYGEPVVVVGAQPSEAPVLFDAARHAAHAGHDDVLHVLLLAIWQRGGVPLQSPVIRRQPLLAAVADGDAQRVVAYLQQHDRPDFQILVPAYQLAAQEGHIEILRLLRSPCKAAIVAAKTAEGLSMMLSRAIQSGNADAPEAGKIVAQLLKHGADPDAIGPDGKTARDAAKAIGNPGFRAEILKALPAAPGGGRQNAP